MSIEAITRCGRDDAIHNLLRAAVCVPIWRYRWVKADGFTFVPELCDTIYGDGRALYRLTMINSRPQFYVVRCDSGWDESNWSSGQNFGDFVDNICWDLEEQFGPARCDADEDDPEILAEGRNPWPALDDEGGMSWGKMDWPKLPGIETEIVRDNHGWRTHTILARACAVEDQLAAWADDGGPVIERRYW